MKENAMRGFGVFLATAALGAALVAGGPALARGGFGGGGYEYGGLAAHLFDGKELCYVASEARFEREASK
jgi:hypothetical protein